MPVDTSNLKYANRGDFPTAEDHNVLVRYAKRRIHRGDGYSDLDNDISGIKPRSFCRPIQVYSDVDIPKYSVFSLAAEPTRTQVTTYVAKKLSLSSITSTPLLIATNHEIEIPAGTMGWCFLITHDEPYPVRFTGTAPMVGHWCGIEFDTFEVCNHRTGLVCVSKAGYDSGYYDDDGVDLINVVRAREPIRVIGEVIEPITPFSNGRMGSGKIAIKYRESTYNELIPAYAPNDGYAFEVDVFNYSSMSFENYATVSATDTLGVGLCVDVGGVQQVNRVQAEIVQWVTGLHPTFGDGAVCILRSKNAEGETPFGSVDQYGQTWLHIFDWAGCVFISDPYYLLGKWTWADFMMPANQNVACSPTFSVDSLCRWSTSGLCCAAIPV